MERPQCIVAPEERGRLVRELMVRDRNSRASRPRSCGAWMFLFLLMAASLVTTSYAQDSGAVSGVVVSTWDGTPLPGVVVSVRGTTLATQSDSSGRYELKNIPPGDHVLRFSKSGYASVVVTEVRVLLGQTTTVNGNIRPEFHEMEEYEVTAEMFTEQTERILFERQTSSSLMDAIGSEQFSRYGASDAGQIVGRVTGVSVVGGKFAVVRGLSDRYTRTLLNGVEVPSADPYRMSPQLDLFPASMIDRVAVSKSFTPDQPGGTGGGTIDIITKAFPEKPFLKVSMGTSYNPDSNLRDDFLAAPDSSMNLLAWPSSSDELDSGLYDLTERINRPPNAVGSETLARATSRREQAEAVSALLQGLGPVDFAGEEKDSPLNTSFSVSGGRTVDLFGSPLGVFASFNYNRNFSLLDDYDIARYSGAEVLQKSGRETRSNIKTDYGVNVNLGYRLSELAEFGFNFMLVQTEDQEARHTTMDFLEDRLGDTLEKWQLNTIERQVQNYQFSGKHTLEFLANSQLDWTVNYAETTQHEPDQRFMNYFLDSEGRYTFGDANLPVPQFPSRYSRKIDEESWTTRADWSLPLDFLREDSKFKMGFYSSSIDRTFKEQYFGYTGQSGFDINRPNSYLDDPALLDYTATHLGGIRTNYSWARYVEFVVGRPYTAEQEILAGYPMLDVGVLSWLRVIGGVRVESTYLNIETRDTGSSLIDEVDLLPSISGVITLRTNLQLRAGYGETVARPSFREKAPISNYLPDLDLFADGNPNLQMSSIRSYDLRLEWFPSPGDLFSIGAFYKDLKKPIELYRVDLSDSVTWINREEATLWGIEFEARKSLGFLSDHFQGLTLGANVALIHSETDFTDDEYRTKTDPDQDGIPDINLDKSRPLFDQSPYVINLDLSYDHPTSGTAFTVAANMLGERIVLTTAQGNDIYEHTPITLDAMISQKMGKYLTLRVGVKNILDGEYTQTYGDSNNDPERQSFRRGRSYGVNLTAEF